MYVHHFLRMVNEGKVGGDSMFSKLKSYVLDYSSKPFYYNIGGLNFTLEEIKHGLLRGNKKPRSAYLNKTLGWGDQRLSLIREFSDPRVNFVCLDFPDIPEHIDSFPDGDSLYERLDQYVSEIVNAKVNVDTL